LEFLQITPLGLTYQRVQMIVPSSKIKWNHNTYLSLQTLGVRSSGDYPLYAKRSAIVLHFLTPYYYKCSIIKWSSYISI
jgi:hypothetical protein